MRYYRLFIFVLLGTLFVLSSWFTRWWFEPTDTSHLQQVPKEAEAVVLINPRNLGVKFSSELLFNRDKVQDLFDLGKEREGMIFKNTPNSGIDVLSPMAFYTLQTTDARVAGATFRITDADAFKSFVTDDLNAVPHEIGTCWHNEEVIAGMLNKEQGFAVWAISGTLSGADAEHLWTSIGEGLEMKTLTDKLVNDDVEILLQAQDIGGGFALPRAEISAEFGAGNLTLDIETEENIETLAGAGGIPLSNKGMVLNGFSPELRTSRGIDLLDKLFLLDKRLIPTKSFGLTGGYSAAVTAINQEEGTQLVPKTTDQGTIRYVEEDASFAKIDFDLWLELENEDEAGHFVQALIDSGFVVDRNGTYIARTHYTDYLVFFEFSEGWIHLASSNDLLRNSSFDRDYSSNDWFEMKLNLGDLVDGLEGIYSFGSGQFHKINITEDIRCEYVSHSDGTGRYKAHIDFKRSDVHSLILITHMIRTYGDTFRMIMGYAKGMLNT